MKYFMLKLAISGKGGMNMKWPLGSGTVKTLNIGTLRPAAVVVLNIKQFNFTMK